MPFSILLFLAVAGGLAIFVNLVLPDLWYRLRLRGRTEWGSAHGFQRCGRSMASPLDGVALPLFATKRGTVFSCLSRGPLTVVDYGYTQSLGDGRPAEGVDVRRATTGVLLSLGRDVPHVIVRPRLGRAPQWLLNQAARRGGRRDAIVDALLASIETGDRAFDGAFQVMGGDESQVRAVLDPGLRAHLAANARFSYEIGGRHAVVYASGLAFGDELEQLIAATDTLRRDLL